MEKCKSLFNKVLEQLDGHMKKWTLTPLHIKHKNESHENLELIEKNKRENLNNLEKVKIS